jgi:hypothetical protein
MLRPERPIVLKGILSSPRIIGRGSRLKVRRFRFVATPYPLPARRVKHENSAESRSYVLAPKGGSGAMRGSIPIIGEPLRFSPLCYVAHPSPATFPIARLSWNQRHPSPAPAFSRHMKPRLGCARSSRASSFGENTVLQTSARPQRFIGSQGDDRSARKPTIISL